MYYCLISILINVDLPCPCLIGRHHLQHGESLVLERLRLTQDGDAEVYGSDDEDSDAELGDGHRHLEQLTHTSSGNITIRNLQVMMLHNCSQLAVSNYHYAAILFIAYL